MSDRSLMIEVKGGRNSFVQITATDPGMVHIFVVESMVIRIDQKVSVASLACILAAAQDAGLQRVVDGYLSSNDQPLTVYVEHVAPLAIDGAQE